MYFLFVGTILGSGDVTLTKREKKPAFRKSERHSEFHEEEEMSGPMHVGHFHCWVTL